MKKKLTKKQLKERKSIYNKEYRSRPLKEIKEARAKDFMIKLNQTEKLFVYFKDTLDLDLLINSTTQSIVKYRSLFNTLSVKKLGLRQCDLIRFYASKNKKFNNATITHSLKEFDTYFNAYSEIKELYKELSNNERNNKETVINIDRRKLTPIQYLVDNLEDWQISELTELIELKKKSWSWKHKDTVKIYTAT